MLAKVQEDSAFGAVLTAHYRSNPVDFIMDWGTTYDPRTETKLMPFLLFPRQQEYIWWLYDLYMGKEDGIAEKCRDVGFTWLNVVFAAWLFIFHSNTKVGIGSRKESLVDKNGDPDAIFEKIRLFLDNLPPFLKPEINSAHMRITNMVNGSAITGEAGDNIGRGGRSSIYFLDEAAFIERSTKVDAALSQNSNCKVYVSTPNGSGNTFYRKRFSGNYSVFTFNWRDDPRKDQAWYEEQKRTLDPVVLAQEVDIDYAASTEGICIPAEWVKAAVKLKIDDSGMVRGMLDVADEGGDENVFTIAHGPKVYRIIAWKVGDVTKSTRKTNFICGQEGVELFRYDNIGVGAGVKGELNSLNEQGKVHAVNVAPFDSRSGPTPGDYNESKSNKDMFLNYRAQAWWLLRERFQRTYQHANNLAEYDDCDLISIPNDGQLIAELSQPKWMINESGKIKLESKEMMRKRGVRSPNRADTLAGLFAPLHSFKEPKITGPATVKNPTSYDPEQVDVSYSSQRTIEEAAESGSGHGLAPIWRQ